MPNISRIYKQECIFCEKDKYFRSSHSREKMVKATKHGVDESLGKLLQRNANARDYGVNQ